MELDRSKIMEYQKNRDPYLMIDYVTNVIPGEKSDGYKLLRPDEWFFKVHWPDDPNMPGALQLEALTQMSAMSILTLPGNKGKTLYVSSIEKIRFYKKVIPNERFVIKTRIKKFLRGIADSVGQGYQDDILTCEAQFKLVMYDELNNFKINKCQ